ncbi:Large-conductance mechanosensitive channel [Brachybacterium faecium]|uniref:Large-conductance mechanosensitive channel n=1 Tax=Brachybacterium faecium (strain ATCC 43885 / DSM 4810 / JCM 11609 / LMG 19847 / NBRC 14762 / NCIMB 9860 / 6-10) TaxID=446465 RepID=C7MC43_BRAFD|nr:large conductance mechanosensitive channel protein MscL [Brachybacterium faecium]ACU85150.1 large conductance mechanosensitive channel protein [Brachybacterium faecium DSM 4810]SLN02681.1 Large-conductance mechanosensitive channel [Brachybacterium faecium]HJG51220.1 large conductance mechanosensitive channel protein MscL [Brachybacterium faecium]
MKGFKDFVMQGNVIDLAVGVVIGSAFTALITAFVENLIQPVINVFGGSNVDGLSFKIIQANEATRIDVGGVLSAIIAFLITAAVVYFVFVLPISAARRLDRKRRGLPEEEETSVSEDIVLLTEIRDALTVQQGGTAQPGGPVQPGGPTPQV